MKVCSGSRKFEKNEAGIALLMCLFALLLLTAVGVGLMYMADTDSQVNQNYRDSQRAYFAAQAGIQEARLRMPLAGGPVPTVLPGAGATGVYYITNPRGGGEVVQPWVAGSPFADSELCHEKFPAFNLTVAMGVACGTLPVGNWYTQLASTAPGTNTNAALDYKWVRVTQKMNLSATPDPSNLNLGAVANPDPALNAGYNNTVPICWNGKVQKPMPLGYAGCTDRNHNEMLEYVYRLTALAVTPNGSRRMVQAEVADPPPMVTNAAVDSQDHVTLNGKLTVNGYDYCSCLCAKDNQGNPALPCTSRPGKTCNADKWAIYSANTVDNPNASETIMAGPNPPIAQNQSWDYNIADMINQYRDLAKDVRKAPYNWTCTAGTFPTQGSCGTQTSATFGIPPDLANLDPANPTRADGQPITPQVTYVPGNVKLTSSAQGNGILMIDGDLEINGGLQFYGLVLVRGIIKFTGGGSDKTNISGAVLAGQESLVDNVLGGSATIQYNLCSLTQDYSNNPPKVINAREAMY